MVMEKPLGKGPIDTSVTLAFIKRWLHASCLAPAVTLWFPSLHLVSDVYPIFVFCGYLSPCFHSLFSLQHQFTPPDCLRCTVLFIFSSRGLGDIETLWLYFLVLLFLMWPRESHWRLPCLSFPICSTEMPMITRKAGLTGKLLDVD